eukprot:gene8297-121_t
MTDETDLKELEYSIRKEINTFPKSQVKKFEQVDETTVHYCWGQNTIVFEFPNNYPESQPKIEYWIRSEVSEIHTNQLNNYISKIGKGKCLKTILQYNNNYKHLWDSEKNTKSEKDKKKEKFDLISDFRAKNPKYKNRISYPDYFILRTIEISKGEYLKDTEIEYAKRVKPKKIIKELTEEEKLLKKQKKEAQAIHQATGTMASFLKNIKISFDTDFKMSKKTKLISNIKGLSSFLMPTENRKEGIKARVIVDVCKLIKILGDEKMEWDGFIEEILIYATFIVANLSQNSETCQDIVESRANYVFWNLSKKIRGEIRDHLNDIMERVDIDLNFSMDIFKSFNEKEFSDFKFICLDETIIYAHKCILSVVCGGFELSKNEIYLPKEVSSFCAYQFIKFVYSPTFYGISKEELKKLQSEGIDYFSTFIKHEKLSKLFQNIFFDKKIEIDLESFMEKNIFELVSNNIKEKHSDIEFSCFDSKTDEIKILPAHKVVLTCRSVYFEKMFALGLLESTQQTIQSEFNVDVSKVILTYLYSETPNKNDYLNYENVVECLYASDMYMIRSLKTDCQNLIVQMIEKDNYESLIEIADEFNCPILVKALDVFGKKNKLK